MWAVTRLSPLPRLQPPSYVPPALRRRRAVAAMATPITASPAATALAAPLPPTYAPHVAAAIDAVRLASILTARVQAGLKTGDAVSKEDASPVTVADYGAQALVAWSLAAACTPPIPLVAEEDADDLRAESGAGMADRVTALVNDVLKTARPATPPLTTAAVLDLIDTGASPGGADGMHWVLDPIDGTRGFVGGRQYAVCLGLLDGGRLAAGVLGCPNLPSDPLTAADGGRIVDDASFGERDGVLFFAAAGGGAWTAPLAGPGADAAPARIHAARGDADASSLRFMESYESAHSDFGVAARAAAALGVTAPPLRLDSQAKYGALARGDAAINMRFPRPGYREKIWDHAAGVLIAGEAGAVVTDAGGQPLDFSRGRWLDLDRGIVTAPPGLHERLIEALKE